MALHLPNSASSRAGSRNLSDRAINQNHAPETYERVCEIIYDQIRRKLKPRDDDPLCFAPRRTPEEVMQDENLRRLYYSLELTKQDPPISIDERSFIRRVEERRLHTFLAILIFASCSASATRAFVKKLVIGHELGVMDEDNKSSDILPLSRPKCERLFDGHIGQVTKFRNVQRIFCAVSIRKKHRHKIEKPEDWRFPYLEETVLGEGSFGKVYSVKIAAGHFLEADGNSSNDSPFEVARKDYLLRKGFNWQDEHNIMDKIFSSRAETCENIVESYGSIEAVYTGGQQIYSLFMPKAMFDLNAYMTKHHTATPSGLTQKMSILLSAVGLAKGLEFLHHKMSTPEDLVEFVCYHMDLKPENILVFKDGDRMIWKLSDFGMSRVKLQHREQEAVVKNFDERFSKRESSLSLTKNRRGQGTYLAPEAAASIPSMGTEGDVWSLGGIISILFTYLEFGAEGLKTYTEKRNEHLEAQGYDYFFLSPDRAFNAARPHPEVTNWHSHLIQRARERDQDEGLIVKNILEYLEKSVFVVNQVERKKGTNANQVVDKLTAAYKAYKNISDPPLKPVQEEVTLQASPPPSKGKKLDHIKKWFRSTPPAVDQKVLRWSLLDCAGVKGCSVSPDGTLVAYWTDRDIQLYTAHSLSNETSTKGLMAGVTYTLPSNDCFWQDVCLTWEYLVASTTRKSFECYIFDLRKGNGAEPTLEYDYNLKLPSYPELRKFAISNDSKWFACMIADPDNEHHPGSLSYVRFAELIEAAAFRSKATLDGASEVSSNRSSVSSSFRFRQTQPYEGPADVTQFGFSARPELFCVVRPELTFKETSHKILVYSILVELGKLRTKHVEIDGNNNSNVSFLTAFAPLNKETSFALITRRRRLWVQAFAEKGYKYQRDVSKYRLFRLLVDWEDRQIFAFATTSENNRMLLLSISMPQGGERVTANEIAQLPNLTSSGDTFAAALSQSEGGKYIVISTLRGFIMKVQLS